MLKLQIDVNTGPTSIIGLLTAEIIKEISKDGYKPAAIAIAVAFSVGIYSLAMGLLKLGFLLEFVSLPVLTGFISAAALTIISGQVAAIFGETNIGSGVANQIHDIFGKLGTTKPITFAIGISGIVLLVIMQFLGKKYGKKNKVLWIMAIGRNAIVIILFTAISYMLNKDLTKPLFDLTGAIPSGLVAPKAPDLTLVGKVFSKSVSVFIAAALEHIAIAKSFGRKNGYTIDQSQELTFLGTANIMNSFFGGMAVGGAASRTAVNSESGVKSPLSGIFTTGAVILSVYFLTGALFWIPKATLSAVIIVAVWSIVVPPSTFIGYWKISFADFCASQIAFWVTLFVSAEMGIESATAFMVVCTILSAVFTKAEGISNRIFPRLYPSDAGHEDLENLPIDTAMVRVSYPIIFLNASRTKGSILDSIQTWHVGTPSAFTSENKNPDRLWNELGVQHVALLRSKAGITTQEAEYLPRIRILVIDMSGVIYMDATGVQAFKDMRAELRSWGGQNIEIRFVGLRDYLIGRFERAGWRFVDQNEQGEVWAKDGSVMLFDGARDAVAREASMSMSDMDEKLGSGVIEEEFGGH